jgi:hypothetical protein
MFPGDPDMRGRARALRGRPRRGTPSSTAAASVTGAGRDLAGHRPRGKSAALDIDGTWMKASSTLGVAVKKVVARAGTAVLSPHGFRRTAENLARRAGVDGLVRRAHAGWRSERVQALYATVDPDERRAAGAAVVALVEAAVQPTPAPSSPTTPPVTPTSSAPPDASGSLGTPARAGLPSAPNAPEAAAHNEQKPPEPASADAAGVPALVRPALLVRPVRPSGTPDGNPGVPDESLWN